jgi:predicted transcriptional regulator
MTPQTRISRRPRMTITVERDILHELRILAAATHRTVQAVLTEALLGHLDAQGPHDRP